MRSHTPSWDGVGDYQASMRWRSDAGMTSIELAILYPTVLLVLLSMFQISLYWHTANVVAVAAEEGLNAGQVYSGDDQQDLAKVEAAAAAQWILDTVSHRNGTVTPTISTDGATMTVTVTAESPRVVGLGRWQVQSVAQGRMEAFVPVGER